MREADSIPLAVPSLPVLPPLAPATRAGVLADAHHTRATRRGVPAVDRSRLASRRAKRQPLDTGVILPDPMFSALVVLAICPPDQFINVVKVWSKQEEVTVTMPTGIAGKFLTFADDRGTVQFVWLRGWESMEHFITLVHELAHLTFEVVRQRRIRLVRESEEVFTYYQGLMLRNALHALGPFQVP